MVPDVPKSQVVVCVLEDDPDAYSACGEYIDTMLTYIPARLYHAIIPIDLLSPIAMYYELMVA